MEREVPALRRYQLAASRRVLCTILQSHGIHAGIAIVRAICLVETVIRFRYTLAISHDR